jgi:hypothetical protein
LKHVQKAGQSVQPIAGVDFSVNEARSSLTESALYPIWRSEGTENLIKEVLTAIADGNSEVVSERFSRRVVCTIRLNGRVVMAQGLRKIREWAFRFVKICLHPNADATIKFIAYDFVFKHHS